MLTEERIDAVVDAVLGRFDHAPSDTQLDIYVWSDGRVTGPPAGNEGDNERLLMVVTPNGERPTREGLRETLRRGLDVVDQAGEPPVEAAVPLPKEEAGSGPRDIVTSPHFKN